MYRLEPCTSAKFPETRLQTDDKITQVYMIEPPHCRTPPLGYRQIRFSIATPKNLRRICYCKC